MSYIDEFFHYPSDWVVKEFEDGWQRGIEEKGINWEEHWWRAHHLDDAFSAGYICAADYLDENE